MIAERPRCNTCHYILDDGGCTVCPAILYHEQPEINYQEGIWCRNCGQKILSWEQYQALPSFYDDVKCLCGVGVLGWRESVNIHFRGKAVIGCGA